jgi:hypothetical protein
MGVDPFRHNYPLVETPRHADPQALCRLGPPPKIPRNGVWWRLAGGNVHMVPDNLIRTIRECNQRAEECERRAKAQTNPDIRKALRDIAKRWRQLAPSLEIVWRHTAPTDSPKHSPPVFTSRPPGAAAPPASGS